MTLFSLFVLLLCLGAWVDAGTEPSVARGDVAVSQVVGVSSATTLVGLIPADLELQINEIYTLTVMVYDVTDLNAFHARLSFDPAVIQILDAKPLESGINLAKCDTLVSGTDALNECDNVAGEIQVFDFQIGQLGKSGSFCLFYIGVQAVGKGDALLRFDELALTRQSTGADIDYDLLPQTLLVVGPTATPTMTPTVTRTSTLTPQPSPTPYYELDPDWVNPEAGEEFDVAIRTSDVANLRAVSILITWDPSMVEVVDSNLGLAGTQLQPGTLFDGYEVYWPPSGNEANNALGRLNYQIGLKNPTDPGVSGTQDVATIRFRALQDGRCDLEFLTGTQMSTSAGNVPIGWYDGAIQIGSVTATPTATETITPTVTATATITVTATETMTLTPVATMTDVPTVVPPTVVVPTETATPSPTVLPPTPTRTWVVTEFMYAPLIFKVNVLP